MQQKRAIRTLAWLCLLPAPAVAQTTLWETYVDAGNKAFEAGDHEKAEKLYLSAIQEERTSGSGDARFAQGVHNLAEIYRGKRKHADAEPLYKQSLAIREKALGPDHPNVAASLFGIASIYDWQGKRTEAELLHQRALVIRERALGTSHPDEASSLRAIGELFVGLRKYTEAEPLLRRSLDIREKALGPEHPDVANSLLALGLNYAEQNKHVEAEPLYKRALAIWTAPEPDHPDAWIAYFNLGNLYKRRADGIRRDGDEDQADVITADAISNYQGAVRGKPNLHETNQRVLWQLLLRAKRSTELEQYCDDYIKGHEDAAVARYFKGILRESEEKWAEALDLYQKALSLRLEKDLIPDASKGSGRCLMRLKQWGEAIRLFENAAKDLPRDYALRMNLGKCHLEQGRLESAEREFNGALELRPDDQPAKDHLGRVEGLRQKGKSP